MKTTFVIIITLLIFTGYGCQKKTSAQSIDQYKQTFFSLPALPILNNYGRYELRIDSINHSPLAYYYVSGKLFYQGALIWQADSTFAISASGNDSLVLLLNMTASIGSFDSYFFYQGADITAKAKPENFPKIAEIRLAGNLIYLAYGDYSSFHTNRPNRYGSLNLRTWELKTD
jgi:hypothetical protein